MTVLSENMITALSLAIEVRRKYEREVLHYTSDSAQVAGWEETLNALKRGEHIFITNG